MYCTCCCEKLKKSQEYYNKIYVENFKINKLPSRKKNPVDNFAVAINTNIDKDIYKV